MNTNVKTGILVAALGCNGGGRRLAKRSDVYCLRCAGLLMRRSGSTDRRLMPGRCRWGRRRSSHRRVHRGAGTEGGCAFCWSC